MNNRRQPRYTKGQRIGGRYLVHQALMGGMGEVYLCLDEQENLPYALKTFQGSDIRLRSLFESEVENWIALEKHPNIVRLFYTRDLDNIPFMILEWIGSDESKGTDLRSWLQYGALDLPLALRFTIDIVRGLQYANEKSPGIVHRDLKPDNVLVNQSRQAKITDFGLAMIAKQSDMLFEAGELAEVQFAQSMRVGTGIGTPAYMPPEQWRGDTDIDFRADIYAVGCILYELLTGNQVFSQPINIITRAEYQMYMKAQHLSALIPTLSDGLPAELKSILNGCLAKRREDRYGQLAQLIDDLMQVYQAHSNEPLPEVTAQAFTAVDYNNRGITFDNLGKYERAIQDYDYAIRFDPNDAKAYSNRGSSYNELGQYEQAIQDFDQAIRLDINLVQAYYNRGISYYKIGQYEHAIQDYDQAICLDINLVQAYYNRGISYYKIGQYKQAIQDFDQTIRLDINFAQAYYNRGIVYNDLGNPQQAIQDYDHAINLDSAYAIAYYNRGIVYNDLGNPQQAIKDYDQAIRLDPANANAYLNRGVNYDKLGQYERAIQDYDYSIHLNPNDAQVYYNRGNIYTKMGQYERAIQNYDQAIYLDPDLALAYFNKGIALVNTERLQEALPYLEKAYALGFPRAVDAIQQVQQMLGMQVQADPDDLQAASDAFIQTTSLDGMREVIKQFPILRQMIPSIEQVIEQQVPPEHKPALEQKLSWLQHIVEEG